MRPVRLLSGLLAVSHTLSGAALLALPGPAARSWIGRAAGKEGTKVLTRALGARDVALGTGALSALVRGADARPWMAAAVVADGADLVVTLAAREHLPDAAVRFAAAMAGASTAVALAGALGAGPTAGTAP